MRAEPSRSRQEANELRGCYGLRLVGDGEAGKALAEADHWMLAADPLWPQWRIQWVRQGLTRDGHAGAGGEPPASKGDELFADRARLAASGGGSIELDRRSRSTRFSMSERVSPAALAHPYLASTAAIAAHWLGRTPFHAGGFVVDGRAWGILGGREMGKSSLLMGLHARGVSVVSDDLVIVDEGCVYSGPRCLDLRETAAQRFGAGRPLGRVGFRERWRVDLPPVPGKLPLAGWVVLGWSDTMAVSRLGARQGLAVLAMNRGIVARGEAPQGLLDAVTVPVVLFSRPKAWKALNPGLDRLLSALDGA